MNRNLVCGLLASLAWGRLKHFYVARHVSDCDQTLVRIESEPAVCDSSLSYSPQLLSAFSGIQHRDSIVAEDEELLSELDPIQEKGI